MIRSRTTIAIPPGVTIKEQIVERKMNQKEFSARMGMSEKHISRLINGEVQLTMDVAGRLEMVLGPPADFWYSLELHYREDLMRAAEENSMEEDIKLAKKMPYKEMAENGWVEDVSVWTERVINLRKFFEIAQLVFLREALIPGVACRRSPKPGKEDFTVIVWAQKAKLEARKIETGNIDMASLGKVSSKIRKMNFENMEEFYKEAADALAECGVAVVFLPYIKDSFLHGVTFRDKNKIVMGLTTCGDDIEKFRFSVFHELAHIIYGHVEKPEGTTEDDERCADEYAEKMMTV